MDESEGHPGKPKGARANREGKPWQRADGRWTVRVYAPDDSTTDPRPRQVYGKTRKEVVAKRAELEGRLTKGIPKDPDQTVGDYLHRWLYVTLPQYVRAGDMAESTLDSYRDNTERHIIPATPGTPTLRHIKLTALDVPLIREWQDRLSQKPAGRQRRKLRAGETELPPPAVLSPRTVAYCRSILHKALEDAVRDEIAGLEKNLAHKVRPPKRRRKKARVIMTPEQAGALLDEMGGDRLWCYWLLAFALGFRRGEGLGMRWSDLDLDGRVWEPQLTVQRLRGLKDPDTGKRGKSRLVAKELKTEASAGKVALGVTAADALKRWQREQRKARMSALRWLDADLVFTTGAGTALEPRNINRAWVAMCARAGVPGLRLHDLRHACASFLLAAGVDLETVRMTLRHANLSTTEMYLHALQEVPRAAADAMDELLTVLRPAPRKSGT